VLLILGILTIMMGALVIALGQMNRATGGDRARLNAIFLYTGAMIVTLLLIFMMEYTNRIQMHQAAFYQKVSFLIPLVLTGLARASGLRWAATITTSIYTIFLIGFVWILPLFPAEPKLGPVYVQVTHFVPPEFPLLLLIPAIALDLLWSKTAHLNKWLLAAISGLLFFAIFAAVQWPFAGFLMSPNARNWIFGAHYMGYYQHPNSYLARNLFLPTETDFTQAMAIAAALAIAGTRLGLGWGDWMRKIRR
jgi:hypothetical protein